MRSKIFFTILTVVVLLIIGLAIKNHRSLTQSSTNSNSSNPHIISTNPTPLDNGVISPNQEISISFSEPLQNKDEIKYQFDPPEPINLTLSEDRKVVKISPQTPYPIGSGFTLIISSNTKFESGRSLDGDQVFHFKTPSYSGV